MGYSSIRPICSHIIPGTDYLPNEPPVLRMKEDNNMSISVPVAPDDHHIESYTILILSANTTVNYTTTVVSMETKLPILP